MQVLNQTTRMPKRFMLCRAYLVRWFEFLRPDICQHYLGFTWQIFYQGQTKLLVLSNKEKEFPSWIFDILSDLLGEPILLGVGHNLLAMESSEKRSISRFHQHLLALEKKWDLVQSFSVFVDFFDTFDLVSAWIEVSKER
jgi:hypothetical protein